VDILICPFLSYNYTYTFSYFLPSTSKQLIAFALSTKKLTTLSLSISSPVLNKHAIMEFTDNLEEVWQTAKFA